MQHLICLPLTTAPPHLPHARVVRLVPHAVPGAHVAVVVARVHGVARMHQDPIKVVPLQVCVFVCVHACVCVCVSVRLSICVRALTSLLQAALGATVGSS